MTIPVRAWGSREAVEAYDPRRHRGGGWEDATVIESGTERFPYVLLGWADGTQSMTYHLNVREPGAADPVSLLPWPRGKP